MLRLLAPSTLAVVVVLSLCGAWIWSVEAAHAQELAKLQATVSIQALRMSELVDKLNASELGVAKAQQQLETADKQRHLDGALHRTKLRATVSNQALRMSELVDKLNACELTTHRIRSHSRGRPAFGVSPGDVGAAAYWVPDPPPRSTSPEVESARCDSDRLTKSPAPCRRAVRPTCSGFVEGKRWGECVATDWMREMELITSTSSTLASLLVSASHRHRQHGGGGGGGGGLLTALSPMDVATIASEAVYSRGIVTETRLRESIGRLQLGCDDNGTREVPRPTFTVLALGGSITADGSYTTLLARWLETTLPTVNVVVLNRAVGATGADVPSFCVFGSPGVDAVDLIVAEFAVNPSTMESLNRLHRRALALPRQPAVVSIELFLAIHNPVDLAANMAKAAVDEQEKRRQFPTIAAAEQAGATIISMAAALKGQWGRVMTITPKDMIDVDGNHPSAMGHLWIFHALSHYLAGVIAGVIAAAPRGCETAALPAPSPSTAAAPAYALRDTRWGDGRIRPAGATFDAVAAAAAAAAAATDGFEFATLPGSGGAKGYWGTFTVDESAALALVPRTRPSEPSAPRSIGFVATPHGDCHEPRLGFIESHYFGLGAADVTGSGDWGVGCAPMPTASIFRGSA